MSKGKNITASFLRGLSLLISGLGVGWLIGMAVSPVIHIVITSLIAFVVSVTSALAGIKVDKGEDKDDAQSARRHKLQVEVNPLPMMFMVIGLVIGASLGALARTNDWLGPRAGRFAEQWKDTELSRRELSRRLFDQLYPPQPAAPAPEVSNDSREGGETQSDGAESSASKGATENGNQSPSPDAKTKEPKNSTRPTTKSMTLTGGGDSSRPSDPDKSRRGVLFTASSQECSRFHAARDESLKDELTSSGDARLRQKAERCQDLKCLKALVEAACPKSSSE